MFAFRLHFWRGKNHYIELAPLLLTFLFDSVDSVSDRVGEDLQTTSTRATRAEQKDAGVIGFTEATAHHEFRQVKVSL